MSHSKSTILFRAGQLRTGDDVMTALTDMANKFERRGWKMPPVPSNPASLAPCSIEVIEYEGFYPRQRTIRFYRDGLSQDLFFDHWDVGPA
jgi:hypothetical protein